jgi:hypothetical protein
MKLKMGFSLEASRAGQAGSDPEALFSFFLSCSLSVAGVTVGSMSFPGVGAEQRECVVCGKKLLIYREKKRRVGYFCSRGCQKLGGKLFRRALAEGRIKVNTQGLL